MKLRMIGNSLGTTFRKELLKLAGFDETTDLVVRAERGKLIITRAVIDKITIDFTPDEITALGNGDFNSDVARNALLRINSQRVD